MGAKKKRKSAGGEEKEQQRKKGAPGQPAGPAGQRALAWKGGDVRATLAGDQALLFLGRGSLTVASGAVLVHGKLVQPGDAAVELCADERVGGPLLLEPLALDVQVPRAAGGAAVELTVQSSAREAAGAASGGERTFSVFLADDPAAPRLLPFGPPWQQAVAEVVASVAHAPPGAPAVIVICGAKKAGKSTFARQLVNVLLNQHPAVAFMDTDCGQTECTPPGLVSLSLLAAPLLGPPHMRLCPPAASFFVGDLSPACDPLLYLRYVRELYRWYRQHGVAAAPAAAAGLGCGGTPPMTTAAAAAAGPLPPLVVNTHGWVRGLGLDLLVELLQALQPVSHLVQLCAPNPNKNLPEGAWWAAPGAPAPLVWQLPALGSAVSADAQPAQSGVSQSSARTAATAAGAGGEEGGRQALAPVESRALHWGAFARACAAVAGPGGSGSSGSSSAVGTELTGTELADTLARLEPYVVSLDDVAVQVLHSPVPPAEVPVALNGALVGLCSAPPAQGSGGSGGEPDPALPCLGLAIVRGVDVAKRLLFVLSPLGEEAMQRVSVLQVGKLELPSSLLQSGTFLAPHLALFSLPTLGTGAGAIRSRNNLLRQSQL